MFRLDWISTRSQNRISFCGHERRPANLLRDRNRNCKVGPSSMFLLDYILAYVCFCIVAWSVFALVIRTSHVWFYTENACDISCRGQIQQIGTADEIREKPATPFVASFLADINKFPSSCQVCACHAMWKKVDGQSSATRPEYHVSG